MKDVQVHANRTEEAARNAAKQYDLNPDQFVAFMNTRFGHYSPCYAYEWAERIAAGRAYRCADEKNPRSTPRRRVPQQVSPTMMETVTAIVQAHGYDSVHDMTVGDHIKVEHDHQMPLTIEKIGDDRLSAAHYYTQRGDLMSDPEVVFRLTGDTWTPVRYTQHPHIHQHDETGLTGVNAFVTTWDRNLRSQGYITTATNGGDA